MTLRQEKVNELLLEEVSKLIVREVDFPSDIFVTVVKVQVDPALARAKVWVSVLPFSKKLQAIKILKRNRKIIQHKLNKRLYMRHVPKIEFRFDDTEEKAWEVERILDEN